MYRVLKLYCEVDILCIRGDVDEYWWLNVDAMTKIAARYRHNDRGKHGDEAESITSSYSYSYSDSYSFTGLRKPTTNPVDAVSS